MLHRERLEGRHGLIIVHGEHGIEMFEVSVAEEFVGGVWPESLHPTLGQLLDGRCDDPLLLIGGLACRSGIECQHGNARIGDVEIAPHRLVQQFDLTHEIVFVECLSHTLERHTGRGKSQPQVVVYIDGEGFLSLPHAGLNVAGVPREWKTVHLHIVTIHRSGHQHIEESFPIVGHCLVECFQRSVARLRGGHSQFHLHLFLHGGQQIDAPVAHLLGRIDNREVGLQVECLAVVGRHFGRPIDDGRTKFQHLGLGKSLKNQFISDTIGIAVCNRHTNFSIFHKGFIYLFRSSPAAPALMARCCPAKSLKMFCFSILLFSSMYSAVRRRQICLRRGWRVWW